MTSKPDKLSAIHRSRKIISNLHIEKPEHIIIEDIAAMRGAFIKEAPLLGADGRLATVGSKGIITVRSDIDIPGKKRFVIAHELGHFELHRGHTLNFDCTDNDFRRWYTGNPIEIEANYFAAELLMPEDIISKQIEGQDVSKNLIQSLAEEFSTSITATSIRFVTLRPDYALICSEDSKIKWFVIDNDHFPYYANTAGPVHPESMACEYYKGGTLSDNLFQIEPYAWLDRPIRGTLKELAISLGVKYNQVLSFLYVDTADTDEEDSYQELDGYPKFHK